MTDAGLLSGVRITDLDLIDVIIAIIEVFYLSHVKNLYTIFIQCSCRLYAVLNCQEVVKYTKRILKMGDRSTYPSKGDTVECYYTGKLDNGKVFDTNVDDGLYTVSQKKTPHMSSLMIMITECELSDY